MISLWAFARFVRGNECFAGSVVSKPTRTSIDPAKSTKPTKEGFNDFFVDFLRAPSDSFFLKSLK